MQIEFEVCLVLIMEKLTELIKCDFIYIFQIKSHPHLKIGAQVNPIKRFIVNDFILCQVFISIGVLSITLQILSVNQSFNASLDQLYKSQINVS